MTNHQVRRILYVDASFNTQTKQSKICLYDKEIKKIDVLDTNIPTSSSLAECYAIVYACLYVKKYSLLNNKIHILSDNDSVTTNKKIQALCSSLNISLSWIPREINEVANDGTKKESNIDSECVNIYDFFYHFIMEIDILKQQETINTSPIQQNIETNEKLFLINAFKQIKPINQQYVSLGEIGKYLKQNHINYKSLKKLLEKYPNDFVIVNENYVQLK